MRKERESHTAIDRNGRLHTNRFGRSNSNKRIETAAVISFLGHVKVKGSERRIERGASK